MYLEATTRRYIGSSTDTKPIELSDTEAMPPGSSFMETDTGKIYRWDGFVWQHHEALDEQLHTLQLMLVELTQLRQLVTLAAS